MNATMRVVVAEDQALLREGVVRLLLYAGFDVVAEAGDAPDLLRKVGAQEARRRDRGRADAAGQHR